MGASLGLAARARGVARAVVGYARRDVARKAAVEQGIVDEAFATPVEAVEDADLVVLCMPVLAIPECVAACRSHLKPGCVLTDVGSTKRELVSHMAAALRDADASFVGSHPIAGSHQTGMQSAREDLYQDATVVVTPADAAPGAVTAVEQFWTQLGSHVVQMPPDEHDRMVACTSHLPHLVAAALVEAVCSDGPPVLCGTGFRDTSRIAAGSEDVWHDILKSNRDSVQAELGRFSEVLTNVQRMLAEEDFEGLRAFLGKCRELRLELD